MSRRKFRWYMMSVLAYYRSEWTEVSDDDHGYRLLVTRELEQLIKSCMRRGTSVPNAAKEVEIFLDLEKTRADAEANLKPLPESWKVELKSHAPHEELRVEPKPQESDDEPNS